MNYYPYILATHIIFIVTWFAGLFYIVRLFIYHTEALQKEDPEKTILAKQFEVMEKRLMQIITTPSMFLVLATGITLLSINSAFLEQGWMQMKLFFVACVVVYHIICLRIMKQLAMRTVKIFSLQLRMLNELATVFLVAVVFLVELKNMFDMLIGVGGLIVLSVVLMIAIRIYKKRRKA